MKQITVRLASLEPGETIAHGYAQARRGQQVVRHDSQEHTRGKYQEDVQVPKKYLWLIVYVSRY